MMKFEDWFLEIKTRIKIIKCINFKIKISMKFSLKFKNFYKSIEDRKYQISYTRKNKWILKLREFESTVI